MFFLAEWITFAMLVPFRWIPETENPPNCPSKKCRSTLWNKGGVDGRTREARIKAGRSHKTATRKH